MNIKAIDVRRGMAVNFKDGIWIIISNEKVAKGNWRSYQVVQFKNLRTGQLIEQRCRTDEEFEQVMLDRKQMEYIYSDGSGHVIMDTDTYEQIHLPGELIGDGTVYLTPNIMIEVAYVDGQPVTAELPNSVELDVVDTPPQVKGGTATNQLKDAICDSGARVKVPSFVENGTKIKVDTRTGEYLGRA